MKNGNGKLTFADGSYYKGKFADNEINGIGYYFWMDGKTY
jgi:hypothetical protein